jgi:flagellar hook assembly protein FlgD
VPTNILPSPLTGTVTPTTTSTPGHREASAGSPVVIRQNVVRPSLNQALHVGVWLDHTQRITVRIYSQSGRLIKVLEDRIAEAGSFETVWTGVNQNGSLAGSGVYFVEIQTDHFNEKRKLVVVR